MKYSYVEYQGKQYTKAEICRLTGIKRGLLDYRIGIGMSVEEAIKYKSHELPPKVKNDLSGKRFGRLIAIRPVGRSEDRCIMWECKCDCGNVINVESTRLTRENTTSCGCFQKEYRKKFGKKYSGRVWNEKEITGMKFGRWTVLKRADDRIDTNGRRYRYWLCRCDCGIEKEVRGSCLLGGSSMSCGCYARERKSNPIHNLSKTRIYNEWKGMIYRCNNPSFKRYYGRGIKVCEEWQGYDGLYRFVDWAYKNGYREDLTIDRIDNDGNYSPENCRWANAYTQMNNIEKNYRIAFNGKTLSVSEWSRISGVNRRTIRARIERGWDAERAIFEKPKKRVCKKEEEQIAGQMSMFDEVKQ